MALCKLTITLTRQISAPYRLRAVLFQFAQAVLDTLFFATGQSYRFRPRCWIGNVERRINILHRSTTRPDAIYRMIAGDGHQPGNRTQVRYRKTIRLHPNFDEHLLKGIFGLAPIVQDTKAARSFNEVRTMSLVMSCGIVAAILDQPYFTGAQFTSRQSNPPIIQPRVINTFFSIIKVIE